MLKFILIVGVVVLAGALIYSSLLRRRPIAIGGVVASENSNNPTSTSGPVSEADVNPQNNPVTNVVYELESEDDLQDALKNTDRLVVLFFMDWCGYCKRMKPEFAAAAKTGRAPCVWAQMNAEKFPNVVSQFKMEAYPTTIVFQRGKVQEVISGAQSQEALLARIK
jgi:thioredoxin-like negative regulator of GroEL